jgi:hypothetical protein
MVEGKMTVLALLDFRKAFDLFVHSLFLYKLVSSFDFHGSARYMVFSFLIDRSMVVEMDGLRSSSRTLFSGMHQGSVPSPLFFSMFVNCLSKCLEVCLQMTCKFIYREIVDDLIVRVIEDLGALSKFQAILVSNSPPTVPLPILLLSDVALEWKDVVTDLGLLIDGRIRFDRHVTKICFKDNATLHYGCSSF